MNPQTNTTNQQSDLSLPPVDPNQAAAAQPAVPNPAPVPAQPLPAPQPAAPAGPTSPVAAQPANSADTTTPLIADDTDLIEKEWVEKAKQLVDQTKDDPYKQNKEINKFKATYIKKRYNKDIQLSKD